jgi:MATE family multidrug resistance protein
VAGSALASTLVDALTAATLLVVWLCDGESIRCWQNGWTRQCWRGWRAYLSIALPALLMAICEWWSWDVVNFLAGVCRGHGHDAQTSLATNALLGTIISLAYCLPFGLQTGVTTLVGNALGAQSPREAKDVALVGFAMGVVAMAAQAGALLAARHTWAHFFTSEPRVGTYVASLLEWAVLFAVGDGLQLVLSGVIMGAGKQRVTTPILVVSYWVLGLPLGGLAALYWPLNGLLGLWWGMTLAVWLHVSSFLLIVFAWPCVPFAIDWAASSCHRGRAPRRTSC